MIKFYELFGWIAAYLTICFYVFPIIPFVNVIKGKLKYEDTPIIVITANYVNYFCWYIYGNTILCAQIELCNLLGAVSSLVLIFIYLIYEMTKYTKDAILNSLIIIAGSFTLYRTLVVLITDQLILGKICIGTAIVVFLFPIELIFRVIKEKNYTLINIYVSNISFYASIFWFFYGLLIRDIYVFIPNVIGAILAFIQINLYKFCKRKYPLMDETISSIYHETPRNEEEKKEESSSIKIDVDNKNDFKENPVKVISTLDN